MDWEPASQVAKNDAGQYVALMGDSWVPVDHVAKNESGQHVVMRSATKQAASPALDQVVSPRPIDLSGSVMERFVPPSAPAVDPIKNAAALAANLAQNPDLVRSPMYAPGVAAVKAEGAAARADAAIRRDAANAAERARRVAVAREATDAAFGGPVGQAIAAPGRRLLSGVYQTMGAAASAPQLLGSDVGEGYADALKMAAAANMPEDPGIGDQIMQAAGQMGPMYAGGALVRGALTPVLGQGLATGVATSLTGGVGGLLSGSQVLDDLRYRDDLTDGDKAARAAAATMFSALTGKMADKYILPGTSALASRADVLRAAGSAALRESAQEGSDQGFQNWMTDKNLLEGVPQAAAIGGIVGGGSRVIGDVTGRQYKDMLGREQVDKAIQTMFANTPPPPPKVETPPPPPDPVAANRAAVDPKRLSTVEQPVAMRRAQDFQERSSEPPRGVGVETMESERMPRRSTDRIAGDEAGGRATPYDPNVRESGDGEYIPRGENKLPAPEREPVQFEGNAPRLEVNDAGRANTDSAANTRPGDAGSGGRDGGIDSQSGKAPRNADAGQGQAPAAVAGRPGPAAEVGRNPRVAEARDVPRLQVNYEKAVTQAKRVATALRNLLAGENPDATKAASLRDQLSKRLASIADMAERLTPERMPQRERKGDSMLTAIRQAGGVTKELAKDIGLDKPDVKLRAGKIKSEDALVFALYDKGWLTHDEYLSPDAYKIATEKIERELRGESADGRTEADLERQARAREREELEADAKRYGIDTTDMTQDQVARAVSRADAARMDAQDREAFNEAVEAAREAERDGRSIDDILDEVGVTEKEREDAKWRREGEAESRAVANEAGREGGGGEEPAASVRRQGPENDGRGGADDERVAGEPGDGARGAGPGEGAGGAGGEGPSAGPARAGDHPDPRYRLNALPLDAAWDAAKRIMGDGRAWADYVKFLKEATSDIAERLKSPRKALADLKEGMTTKTRQNGIAAAVRYLNEDIGRRARIIVDKFDSPTARKVVDMMDFEMGKGEGTQGVFRESMLRRLNVAFNNLKPTMDLASRIIDSVSANGKTRKEAYAYVWEEIIKRVENPSLSRQGEIGAAVKSIEGWFKTMRDMQVESGVDIGDQGPTYFTVKYDGDKIVADTQGFIRDATRAYELEGLDATEAAAKAEALALAKVRGGSFSLVEIETGAANSVTKERVFSKPEALEVMRKWRNLDGREVLMSYAYSAAQRAAIAERFGDNFGGTREKVMRNGKMVPEGKVLVPGWEDLVKKITEEGAAETLPMLRKLVELGTGVNKPTGEGPHAADVFRNVMTMAALEKSVLPNMMEAVTPLATTNGNAAAAVSLMRSNLQAMLSGIGLLPKADRRAAAQRLLEGLGAISDIGANALAMARYSGADTGKGFLSEATAKFFEGIGLTRLEDTNRITAGDVGAVWFDSLAKSILGDKGWRSVTKVADTKYLRDFGIPTGKEKAFAEYVRSLDGRIPTVDELVKAGEMGKLYGQALNRFVHTTVQHADALTRPSWASSPWGSLVFQFSSYTYAFHKNVIRKAFNNVMDAGNFKNDLKAADRLSLATSMVPGFMVMGAASALTMWLRDELFNELAGTKKNLTDEAKAERAILNANLLGKYGRIFEQFGQQRWGGVVGFVGLVAPPSVAQTAKAADSVVRGMMDESKGNSAERKAWKAVYNTVLEPAWQIALSAGPSIPFGAASVGLRTLAPSAGEGLFVDEMAGPERKKRREKPQKGVLEQAFD